MKTKIIAKINEKDKKIKIIAKKKSGTRNIMELSVEKIFSYG